MEMYNDYFTRESLTDALVNAAYVPGQLAGLFETRALGSTTMAIEALGANGPDTLTAIPRGAPLPAVALDKRSVYTFPCQSYGAQGAVYADEVLNARVAGTSGAGELVAARRDETVAKLRRTVDNLHESLRMAVLNAPGNDFGSQGANRVIALATDATKTRAEVFNKLIIPMEAALAGVPFSGIRVICSAGIWDDLLGNAEIKASYLNMADAAAMRGAVTESFVWAGVTWERYRGTASVAITANQAVAVPTGVAGLFLQGFAPDDTIDSVGAGALGSPYYLRAFDLDDAKGWRIRIQTHPVMVCTRPAAVLPVTLS